MPRFQTEVRFGCQPIAIQRLVRMTSIFCLAGYQFGKLYGGNRRPQVLTARAINTTRNESFFSHFVSFDRLRVVCAACSQGPRAFSSPKAHDVLFHKLAPRGLTRDVDRIVHFHTPKSDLTTVTISDNPLQYKRCIHARGPRRTRAVTNRVED